MEALAVHLMWIAAATYCALLAPKNLLATLIGVLGMAHFSLGEYFVIDYPRCSLKKFRYKARAKVRIIEKEVNDQKIKTHF